MNSFTVEINEDCGEVKVTTGIWATEAVLDAIMHGIRELLVEDGQPNFYVFTNDTARDDIAIEEGSPLYIVVDADNDRRVEVFLYNLHEAPATAFARVLEYLTKFSA